MRTDNIQRLLALGAGVRMKATGWETLQALAASAKSGGGTLTIIGALHIDVMAAVAAAGGKHVIFDLSDETELGSSPPITKSAEYARRMQVLGPLHTAQAHHHGNGNAE